jgi:ABC-type multidrug transport system ATPase subunit
MNNNKTFNLQFFLNETCKNAMNISDFVEERICPGTERFGDCKYPATKHWKCESGFYCRSPDSKFPCANGFYCPNGTFEPIFCPEKYSCAAPFFEEALRCPKDHFCPMGSANPVPCRFAFCPEGSSIPNRFYIFPLYFGIILVFLILYKLRDKRDKRKGTRRLGELKKSASLMDFDKTNVSNKLEGNLDIRFEDLSYELDNGHLLMQNITGDIKSGKLTAIMGPSGSGKTTFLNLLANKIKRSSGKVFVNNREEELSKYRKLIGYVPQEDIMLRELTVYDILMHSAMTRLPSEWSYLQKKEKVFQIINFLGLSHVASSIIGDEEKRGVSGGQRKRVNIGMELVAHPSLLLLDEPTSGLDSSTATKLCETLKDIAKEHLLTVVAVIHSPSVKAFKTFDDILLLGKTGQVVYFGPVLRITEYFAHLGFSRTDDDNVADFIMEVVTGNVISKLYPHLQPEDLSDIWDINQFDFLQSTSKGFKIKGVERRLIRNAISTDNLLEKLNQVDEKHSIFDPIKNKLFNIIDFLTFLLFVSNSNLSRN